MSPSPTGPASVTFGAQLAEGTPDSAARRPDLGWAGSIWGTKPAAPSSVAS